jgi:hypothetical protein
MELRTYAKILLRRWWLVVTPLVVVVVYVVATYAPPVTSYRVVMRFSAGSVPAGLSVDYDRYYPWLTSEYIANGLADVAETGVFAQAVAARLGEAGQDVAPDAVQGAIVTEELTQNSGAYYPQLEGLEPVVRLLDEPAVAALPPSLRAQLTGPAIRVGLALFVGVGLAFLWHYLDPTVHDAEELEELGVDVLARIPRR